MMGLARSIQMLQIILAWTGTLTEEQETMCDVSEGGQMDGDVAGRARSDVPTNLRLQEWTIGSGCSTKESVAYSEDVIQLAVVADYATWRSSILVKHPGLCLRIHVLIARILFVPNWFLAAV